MKNAWNVTIRDDVSQNTLNEVLDRFGLTVKRSTLLLGRHLQCEAPVLWQTVESIRDRYAQSLSIVNIQEIGKGQTSFEVFPLEHISLSQMDHDMGEILHLSDHTILKTEHRGPTFRIVFENIPEFINVIRWELYDAGIELGPSPHWDVSPTIPLPSTSANLAENI